MLNIRIFQSRPNILVLIVFLILGLIISTFFKVEIMQGMTDAPLYNNLAKEFLGISDTNHDRGVTSPLYPLLIALIIKIFGVNIYLKVLATLHFVFLALVSYIFYILVLRTFNNRPLAIVFGLFIILNPHLIIMTAQFMSETLGVLLASIYGLFLYRLVTRKGKWVWNLIFLGMLSGLLVLCRYNLILIPVVTLLIVGFEIIRTRNSLRIKVQQLFIWCSIFSISAFIVLNFWALRNQGKFGEYKLFPTSENASSRNAALTVLTEKAKVSPEFQPIKELIIKINKPYEVDLENRTEGRQYLSKYWPESVYRFKYGHTGYRKYWFSETALYEYFSLEPVNSNYYQLSSYLSPFYHDIYKNNRKEFFKLRIISALYTLPPSEYKPLEKLKPNIPLLNNIYFLAAYVFIYFIIILFFLISSVIFPISRIFKKWNRTNDMQWLIIYISIIFWHFIFLHGYTIMMKDSNRYKYCFLPLFFYAALYLAIHYIRVYRQPVKKTDERLVTPA